MDNHSQPTLRQLLTDPAHSGLYRLGDRPSLTALHRQATRRQLVLFQFDGQLITDKASFLHACAQACHFPSYFGKNWDALYDCLTDLSWTPARGYLLLYDHVAPFIQHAPADWAIAREILRDTAAYWRNTGKPFVVFLGHDEGLLPDLPLWTP